MSGNDAVRDDRDAAPVSCTLTESDVERRAEWVSTELVPHLRRVEERDDGFRFVFPSSEAALAAVMKFVQLESRCCSFGTFDLTVSPGDPVLLDFYGPDGSKALIAEGFVSRLPDDVPVGEG